MAQWNELIMTGFINQYLVLLLFTIYQGCVILCKLLVKLDK